MTRRPGSNSIPDGDNTRIDLIDGPYAADFAPMAESGWVQSLDKLTAQALA